MIFPSVVTWPRVLSKISSKGIHSLPSVLQEGHCMILSNLHKETQHPILPSLCLPILLLEHKILFKGQCENRYCNKKWSFQKKINEKIGLWVESNSNSSASKILVVDCLGSKCLHTIMLDILPAHRDIRTGKIKLFLQGHRLFSNNLL